MEYSKDAFKEQEQIQVQGTTKDFFDKFKIGKLMNGCGIRKRHGHSVRMLMETLFLLPFIGKNFYRGIVKNKAVPFGKDAAYEMLKATTYNWRRLLLMIGLKLFLFLNRLTSEERESVLIADDSSYDRSKSKKVELLSKVWDHSINRYIRGFRMLTVCWSDGVSTLPLDFALLSSAKAGHRFCESKKSMNRNCSAYKRRKEALIKSTDNLTVMIKRILKAGIKARYLLMDRWFTMPAVIEKLAEHIEVIGMVKNTPKIHYHFNGLNMDLGAVYRRLKKRPGKAKIKASAITAFKSGQKVKLVFVRNNNKKGWLCILSTDIRLKDENIVRIYGKRWDIEVFFKMAKQHLKLGFVIK